MDHAIVIALTVMQSDRTWEIVMRQRQDESRTEFFDRVRERLEQPK